MFALGFDTALCLLGIGSAAAWLGLVAQERLARRRRAL